MMKYLISLLLLCICCYVLHAQSKTELVYKDGDKRKGLEKIVFKDEKGITVKEFDLIKNDPYQALSLPIQEGAKTGRKRYKIDKNQAAKLFNVNEREIYETNIVVSDHVWVDSKENGAVVSYNLFGYTDYGEENGLRKSTIKVLDSRGIETFTKEVNTDSHSIQLTPNGKYLGYGYGETTHDIQPDEFGYKLINIESGNEIIDIPISILDIAYTKYDYLILRGYKDSIIHTWIFNFHSDELFELKGKYYTKTSDSFINDETSEVIVDLNPYKIR